MRWRELVTSSGIEMARAIGRDQREREGSDGN